MRIMKPTSTFELVIFDLNLKIRSQLRVELKVCLFAGLIHLDDFNKLTQSNRVERKYRILLLEDDQATARVIKNALCEVGFTVEVIHQGLLLPALVERFQPDLLLLDINLPDTRGDTAVKMVQKAYRDNLQTKFQTLILSGLPLNELMEIQRQIGAIGCIQKPASRTEIIARIQQIFPLRSVSAS